MKDNREVFEFYKLLNQNILISYTGPFDNQILAVIAKNIEMVLSGNPRVSKKIFKIFFELAQNISFYSAEFTDQPGVGPTGEGTLIIQEKPEGYLFITGNMVDKKTADKLESKIERINQLDRDKLREFKRAERGRPRSEQGGANIGLIQVALTSENSLASRFIPVNEKTSFYILGALIAK